MRGQSESEDDNEEDEEDATEEKKEERYPLHPAGQPTDTAAELPQLQGGRSKRERKSVDRFDPQVQGKSDKEKKANGSGKKQRKA